MLEFSRAIDKESLLPFRPIIVALLLLGLLFWKLLKIVDGLTKRPRLALNAGFPGIFGQWLSGIHYLFGAPGIISRTYRKAKTSSFVVPTPENHQVFLSSREQIKELASAPESSLSLYAVATDMFQWKYTMPGLPVYNNSRGNENNVHLRALRVLLPKFLPSLRQNLERKIRQGLIAELGSESVKDWTPVKAFPMAKRLTVLINSSIFVGEPLASNAIYLDAALRYPTDVFATAEVIRCFPSFLAPLITNIMTWNGQAGKTVRSFLLPLVEERLAKQSLYENSGGKPMDYVQWLIDSSPKDNPWSAEKVVQKTIAIWFASVHQVAMTLTYALYDICSYPEYVEPLRAEMEQQMADGCWRSFEGMPLLDSFLKESARLNPSDCVSVRRKTLQAYTFSDGTHVPKGNLVCVPLRPIQRDPGIYPSPCTFDGARFLKGDDENGGKCSQFTDLDPSFPFWGLGKNACPGRQHASAVLKMTLAYILLNYDMVFADEDAPRTFSWRTAIVPRSSTSILFRDRSR